MEAARVEHTLDALEAEGARLFDAPSCDCVRSLLTRSEQLGGEAGRLLEARAASHVARLKARFERTRSETRERLAVAEGAHGPLPSLRTELTRGDLVRVRRSLRRLRSETSPRRAPRSERRREAIEYEEALAELVAALALARAGDVVPEGAGPYNPLRIASELLARIGAVSPLYLTVQLNRLEELASLLSLPELPAPAARKLPRKLPRKRRS